MSDTDYDFLIETARSIVENLERAVFEVAPGVARAHVATALRKAREAERLILEAAAEQSDDA